MKISRLFIGLCVGAIASAGVACSDDGGSNSNNNGVIIPNNGDNNGQNNSNNGTTTGTNNGTAGTNNGTTTGTNNGANNGVNNGANNGNTCPVLSPTIGECDPFCGGCDDNMHCATAQASLAEPVTAACVANGGGIQGTTCATSADCAVNHVCNEPPGGGDKTCQKLCRPGTDMLPQCSTGFDCRPYRNNLKIGLCYSASDECNYYPVDTCDDGQQCYDSESGRTCMDYNNNAQLGDSCTSINDCGEFQRCVIPKTGEASVCRQICQIGGEGECPDQTFCNDAKDADGNVLAFDACLDDPPPSN